MPISTVVVGEAEREGATAVPTPEARGWPSHPRIHQALVVGGPQGRVATPTLSGSSHWQRACRWRREVLGALAATPIVGGGGSG